MCNFNQYKTDLEENYNCPIGYMKIEDPVFGNGGRTYERENIEKWLTSSESRARSPLSNQINSNKTPNYHIKQIIEEKICNMKDIEKK